MSDAFVHVSVLFDECLEALSIKPDGVYVDGTAGGGGHSRAIAEKLREGHLYAFDKDPTAVEVATERLKGLPATVVQKDFRHAAEFLKDKGVLSVDGVLLDLGVSSHQLDSTERGFSYHRDAALDMRMSQSGQTAEELVNTLNRETLCHILRSYGEEKYAWQIAGKIVAEREKESIKSTQRLAEVICAALPPAERRKAKNPARKTFQALRIAVNDELGALGDGLDSLFDMLAPKGRFVVLTFHSLEDRMVKQRFRQFATACTCPPEWPLCRCAGVAKGVFPFKNPQSPSAEEQAKNRRSRSAKLRCIEKI